MVGMEVRLTRRVVGAFAGLVGAAILAQSTVTLTAAMRDGDPVALVAVVGTAVGSCVLIVGTMLVFGSLWAQTGGKVALPGAAVFCALRYGATSSAFWAALAGLSVVFFVLLLGRRPSRPVDVDSEQSGVWIGTTHR